MVTHLFNAMQSFHHRDPGLVGLLTSEKLAGNKVWCGIIADGVHAHPAAIRIAYKTSFDQLALVTDAIIAMGFKDGRYKFGQQSIDVRGDKAYVAETQVCSSISMKNVSLYSILPFVPDPDWLRGHHAFQHYEVYKILPLQRGRGSGGRIFTSSDHHEYRGPEGFAELRRRRGLCNTAAW